MEFLFILQDFVPCLGCCPATLWDLTTSKKQGKGTADLTMPFLWFLFDSLPFNLFHPNSAWYRTHSCELVDLFSFLFPNIIIFGYLQYPCDQAKCRQITIGLASEKRCIILLFLGHYAGQITLFPLFLNVKPSGKVIPRILRLKQPSRGVKSAKINCYWALLWIILVGINLTLYFMEVSSAELIFFFKEFFSGQQ